MNVPTGSRIRISSRALVALVAPALVISGCAYQGHGQQRSAGASAAAGPVTKLKVSRAYTGTVTGQQGGTFTPAPDGKSVAVQDRPFNGTLTATLPKKIEVQKKPGSDSTFKLKRLNGVYASSVDGTTYSSGSGQWTGLQLVRFAKRPLGTACLSFAATTTNNDRDETGAFTLIGGTGASKRARFSGTFTQTGQPSPGATSPVSGVITGKLRFNRKPRALTPACRALVQQLP